MSLGFDRPFFGNAPAVFTEPAAQCVRSGHGLQNKVHPFAFYPLVGCENSHNSFPAHSAYQNLVYFFAGKPVKAVRKARFDFIAQALFRNKRFCALQGFFVYIGGVCPFANAVFHKPTDQIAVVGSNVRRNGAVSDKIGGRRKTGIKLFQNTFPFSQTNLRQP